MAEHDNQLNSDTLWQLALDECDAFECDNDGRCNEDGMHFRNRAALLRFAALVIDRNDAERAALSAPAPDMQAAAQVGRDGAVVAWWKMFPRSDKPEVVPGSTFLAEDALATGWRPLVFGDIARPAQAAEPMTWLGIFNVLSSLRLASNVKMAEASRAVIDMLEERGIDLRPGKSADPQPAASQAAGAAVPEPVLQALRFYAGRDHMILADQDAWDTVSGEPQNWWCDEAGTATVEDGSIAAMVLRGEPLIWVREGEDTTPQPIAGETLAAAPAAQPAPAGEPSQKLVCRYPDCHCANFDGAHCEPEEMARVATPSTSAPAGDAVALAAEARKEKLAALGLAMVNMTTTVWHEDEWDCIPALWQSAMEERDELRAKLAALTHRQADTTGGDIK